MLVAGVVEKLAEFPHSSNGDVLLTHMESTTCVKFQVSLQISAFLDIHVGISFSRTLPLMLHRIWGRTIFIYIYRSRNWWPSILPRWEMEYEVFLLVAPFQVSIAAALSNLIIKFLQILRLWSVLCQETSCRSQAQGLLACFVAPKRFFHLNASAPSRGHYVAYIGGN